MSLCLCYRECFHAFMSEYVCVRVRVYEHLLLCICVRACGFFIIHKTAPLGQRKK